MRCDDCKKTGFIRVFIPIPVNTWKPKVCENCAKEREQKWGHTWKENTGKYLGKLKIQINKRVVLTDE